eukprot:GHVT01063542.1.p1 GENE.GHVT01063542.1~~GHVT01063542.1.p1  ORF type:complete len:166 (+),score=9.67 GHVT01063542.1:257-754(+)
MNFVALGYVFHLDSVRQLLKRINPDLNRFLKTQIKESNPDGNLAFVNPRVEVMLKICRALDIISDEDLKAGRAKASIFITPNDMIPFHITPETRSGKKTYNVLVGEPVVVWGAVVPEQMGLIAAIERLYQAIRTSLLDPSNPSKFKKDWKECVDAGLFFAIAPSA